MKKTKNNKKYILLTAARNEEKNIEKTLKSVIQQTIKPIQWIIISDGSTDNTDNIIQSYQKKHNFIKFFRSLGDKFHNFGSKVKTINLAKKQIDASSCDYIGILDADISFQSDYFEELIDRFEKNPILGIGGGIVYEIYNNKKLRQNISLNSVAGAVQLFRYECFEKLGDFLPLKYGGEDAAMEIRARMNSWEVQTFPELPVMHYGYVGKGSGHPLKAKYNKGIMFYQLGYHPLFQIVRCLYRSIDRPYIIGAIVELLSFFLCYIRKEKIILPPDVIVFLRKEQIQRLKLNTGQ
ncbi:MAG: glycosyltransferase family 2 protein [Spirochaetes bacterium]|nr:glycosyltransferase family 2 protein [Spirochaetota bacterium]